MSIEGFLLLEEWCTSRRSEVSERRLKSAIKYKPFNDDGEISELELSSDEHLIKVEIKDDFVITYTTIELRSQKILATKSMEFIEKDDFYYFLDCMLDSYLHSSQIAPSYKQY